MSRNERNSRDQITSARPERLAIESYPYDLSDGAPESADKSLPCEIYVYDQLSRPVRYQCQTSENQITARIRRKR